MKKFWLVLPALCLGILLFAQTGSHRNNEPILATDSVIQKVKAMADSGMLKPVPAISKEEQEQMNRNLDELVQMQRENQRKAKQKAYLQIALGVGFLALLIYGLSRRRKKSA